MDFIIKPSYTAITNGAAKSAKLIAKDINENDVILDYGCGRLRNTIYLKDKGKNKNIVVDIVDLEEQLNKISNNKLNKYVRNKYALPFELKEEVYDKILCSFVINVIEEEQDRIDIIQKSYDCLKKDGYLFIEVRTFEFLKNLKDYEKYKDGYLIGKNKVRTFQKPFGTAELYNLILLAKTQFILRETITHKDSIIVILQK